MVRTEQEGRRSSSSSSNNNNNNNNKSLWTVEEDKVLMEYVNSHGKGRWNSIAKRTGLKRCGKSCRLRWMNYLCPNVKRDGFTEQEEDLIVRLHNLLGNRWSLIAKRVPGRTDNQVKNYWNTHLSKKLGMQKKSAPSNDTSSGLASINPSYGTPNVIPGDGEPNTSGGKDSRESNTMAVFGPMEDKNLGYHPNFWDFEGDLGDFNVMELLGEDSHDLSWLYS